MLIIPAIDIRGGKCVRLFQGDYGKETVYGDDPASMAQRWIREGAQLLHIVDLDGAREGIPRNMAKIKEIAMQSPIPLQIGGGIRDLSTIQEYLSSGIQRVILGTAAYLDPPLLKEACKRWRGSIAVDIASKEGKLAISGWMKEAAVSAVDFAIRCQEMGVAAIVYTDILRDGTQEGINLQSTREVARALSIPVIASGGVSSLKDIEALASLEEEGVIGVIVGKALYDGTLSLPEALDLLERKKKC